MKIITSKDDIKKPRRRFNKNKKKAWRKRIDISDIDVFQEEQRREERFGGPIENKPSDDLFSLDVELSSSKKKGTSKSKRLQKGISQSTGFKQTRRGSDKNSLKCHQFINGLPGAKAISKKQGIVKQKPCRIIWAAMKLSKNTPLAEKKRLQVTAQRKKTAKANKTIKMSVQDNFEKDLWDADNKKDLEMFEEVDKTFMVEPLEYYKVSTRQSQINIPAVRFEKTSSLPAVVLPQPGASYNPSYLDHQNLLAEAVEQETKKRAAIEKEKRMIKKYLPSKKDGITEEKWLQEMSEGLAIGSQEEYHMEEEGGEDAEVDSEAVSGKKIPEKRSKQARKKAKTIRVKEQLRLKKKEINQLESQVFRLKSYQKEIKKEDEKMALRKAKAKKLKTLKKSETKKLSQYKFQEEDICVPMAHELSSSLRTIVPMGNLLGDRYKNLQRRNIIDTRVKIKRKQAKTKKIAKKNLKEDMKKFIESITE